MKKIFFPIIVIVLFSACATNPLSGRRHMALIDNRQLFPMAFAAYQEMLADFTIVTGTPEAEMVNRVGWRIAEAAKKWFAAEGHPNFLDDYEWEFSLIQDNTINAWAMPGGKIAFYTGILPLTQTEDGLAVVMGHEIAHAVLNHGQRGMSHGIIQQIGGLGVSIAMEILGVSSGVQALGMLGYQMASTVGGTLRFSREQEHEADQYGLILMAIAGYDPEAAAPFWERMSALGGASVPEFLSTHPTDVNRIRNIRRLVPEAQQKAAEFGVRLHQFND
jgi:predicted Zn-dependent protease